MLKSCLILLDVINEAAKWTNFVRYNVKAYRPWQYPTRISLQCSPPFPPSITHPSSPSSLLFLCSCNFFHPIPIIDNWHYFNIPIRRSTFYAAILLTRFMCLSKAIRYPAKTLRSPLYLLVQTFILRLSVRQVWSILKGPWLRSVWAENKF